MSEFPEWVEDGEIGYLDPDDPRQAREIHRRLADGSLQAEINSRRIERYWNQLTAHMALPWYRRMFAWAPAVPHRVD